MAKNTSKVEGKIKPRNSYRAAIKRKRERKAAQQWCEYLVPKAKFERLRGKKS